MSPSVMCGSAFLASILACAPATLAQKSDPIRECRPSQVASIQPVQLRSMDCRVSVRPAERPFSPRGDETVFDNSGAPLFNSSLFPTNLLDGGSFTPGPGEGGDLDLTAIGIGFVVATGTNRSFDVVVTFWDELVDADPVNAGQLEGLRLVFEDVAPGTYTMDTLTDITSLPGLSDGIQVPDDDWALQLTFVQPGTSTPVTGVTALFAGSQSTCPPAFAGDGFLTGLDVAAFVAAFESGDPSADYDGDGFLTGLDFDAYVVDFEAGC